MSTLEDKKKISSVQKSELCKPRTSRGLLSVSVSWIFLHVVTVCFHKCWVGKCPHTTIYHSHHLLCVYDTTPEPWSSSKRWSNNALFTVVALVKWIMTKRVIIWANHLITYTNLIQQVMQMTQWPDSWAKSEVWTHTVQSQMPQCTVVVLFYNCSCLKLL